MPRAVVCLPTYNERENLEPMVRALGEALDTSRDSVLVIDDASPDGTGELADGSPTSSRGFACSTARDEGGARPAYVAGFRRALADGAELVARDRLRLLARPEDVPRLIAAARRRRPRARLALRARGRHRELGARSGASSRAADASTRGILGVRVRDLTGGFKCFRRVGARGDRPRRALGARGYAFQIETTYRVLRAGLRVREVPIRFVDRRAGASKMSRLDRRRGDLEGARCSGWRALTGRL